MELFFIILCLVVYFLFLQLINKGLEGMNHTNIRGILTISAVVGLGWFFFLGAKATQGYFSAWNIMPPRFAIVIGVPILLIIVVNLLKGFKAFAMGLKPVHHTSLQTFRFFVEIVLWRLAAEELLHHRMTFEGYNFDILIGLTAIPVAYLVFIKKRWPISVAVIWNYVGIMLLTIVATTGILSAPTPFQVFTEEPANTIIVKFPYVWLPGFLVPLGYFLHILSLRQINGFKRQKGLSES